VARRLTQPFVTWSLLVAEFSELAAEVASKYFTELPSGRYAFRPAYNRFALAGVTRERNPDVLGRFAASFAACLWTICRQRFCKSLLVTRAYRLGTARRLATRARHHQHRSASYAGLQIAVFCKAAIGRSCCGPVSALLAACLKTICHSDVVCSEAAIRSIAPRPESPQWLVEEISRTRAGLMRLRQNVVLLPNTDDSESFYPVCGC